MGRDFNVFKRRMPMAFATSGEKKGRERLLAPVVDKAGIFEARKDRAAMNVNFVDTSTAFRLDPR